MAAALLLLLRHAGAALVGWAEAKPSLRLPPPAVLAILPAPSCCRLAAAAAQCPLPIPPLLQDEIHELLLQFAGQGATVLR